MAQDHSPITCAPCVLHLAFRRHIYYSLTITSVKNFSYNRVSRITLHVIYLNSRLKHLVKTWQGLQDHEIMIGSLPEVLIMRAERPISSYKPRETLIRLLRRNKILQILSTKRKISRPRLR